MEFSRLHIISKAPIRNLFTVRTSICCFWGILLFFSIVSVLSCQKTQWITASDATLRLGADTLFFDTVFTTKTSITKRFTIVNDNNGRLRIDEIRLAGGSNSMYKINVNGNAAALVKGTELAAGDSLYVFVKVTIDPTISTNPFIVADSIQMVCNGNTQQVQLRSYGRQAIFINGGTLPSTIWDAALPYVLLKPVTVAAGATLTLQKGTQVFCNAGAPLIVKGTLRCLGEKDQADRVVFRGDRLDGLYKDLPGGWPGILLAEGSTNHLLRYTNILNAYQGLVIVGGVANPNVKAQLEQCIIHNAYDAGIFAINTSLSVKNCQITQCGNDGTLGAGGSNVIITGGGNYLFEHCTIATFANYYQNHRQPALYISNQYGGQSAALLALFTNSIIYGEGSILDNEIATNKSDAANFSLQMQHVLYKAKSDPIGATFQNSVKNELPQFDSISTARQWYNFRLRTESPAVNKGRATLLQVDLDGQPRIRGTAADLGAFEVQ